MTCYTAIRFKYYILPHNAQNTAVHFEVSSISYDIDAETLIEAADHGTAVTKSPIFGPLCQRMQMSTRIASQCAK